MIGQTGYYLVWDDRSLTLTRMTVAAFDVLGPLGSPLKWWFLNGRTITNLTLANFLFIHIGLSFSLLFVLWLHYVRMQRPVVTPPPVINYVLLGLVVLAVALFPIEMGPMAQLETSQAIPANTHFDVDVFFLWPYWLMNVVSPLVFWFIVAVLTVVACFIPYLVKTPPVQAAAVVDSKCTGCSLCSKDCPFAAIEMVPAPAGSRFKLLAVVWPYRCSGCGVCVGACAFDAIDLPNMLDSDVTAQIKSLAQQAT